MTVEESLNRECPFRVHKNVGSGTPYAMQENSMVVPWNAVAFGGETRISGGAGMIEIKSKK